jgi:D-alanyl-D-alanine carboxypeptidase/D-alanyl-D-alanine-endopeptidase (penicillin-binding protein 4)
VKSARACAFLLCLAGLLAAVPPSAAGAVDRSLGADVPKPLASGLAWSADAKARLGRDIDALLGRAPTLLGAHVGLLALETRSGEVLYAHNPDDAFLPASTNKLVTGSSALAVLGPAFRFRTEAYIDAANQQLVLRPGGDPLLTAADLGLMAQAVRAAGITALPLGVAVDASAFEPAPYPPGWSWDDFPYDYAPALSAATVEENVVHVTVAPGAAAGSPVRVSVVPEPMGPARGPAGGCPFTHAVDVVSRAVTGTTGSESTLDLARDPGGCIDVVGSLPLGAAPETLDASVPSPIWYLRALAGDALRAAGVDVPPAAATATTTATATADESVPVPLGARLLWSYAGEPLSDVLADMWWPSDNLIAEALLKAIGAQRAGTPGTSAAGTVAERAWLRTIGVDPATLTLIDGSGLSSYDRITPRALAAILQADWN